MAAVGQHWCAALAAGELLLEQLPIGWQHPLPLGWEEEKSTHGKALVDLSRKRRGRRDDVELLVGPTPENIYFRKRNFE